MFLSVSLLELNLLNAQPAFLSKFVYVLFVIIFPSSVDIAFERIFEQKTCVIVGK